MKRIIELSLIILSLQACSIKEDRYPCRCVLTLDMSACSSIREGVEIVLGTGAGTLRQYYYPESSPSSPEFDVSRGEMSVCVMTSGQGDSLYACGGLIDINDEFNFYRPSLRKQFATVDLDPTALIGPDCPYEAVLTGASDGLDPLTLKPRRKALSRNYIPGPDGCCRMTVPRQEDDALGLEMICRDGVRIDLPLGQLLRARGYDWTAENLPDVRVALDRKDVEIRISVSGWDLE